MNHRSSVAGSLLSWRGTLVAAAALVALSACGGPAEYQLAGNSISAGTDGLLEVEEVDDHNKMVTLFLEYLPPAERLGEGMTHYVLWLHPANGSAHRAAVLDYDEGERIATAVATTTETCFDAFVTAEAGREIEVPSAAEVVRQRHCPDE